MVWLNAKSEIPSYNANNYLVIIYYLNDYSYAFAFWDGNKWIHDLIIKGAEVVSFTETKPKMIIKNLF